MNQTLEVTALGASSRQPVNLELAMQASDRLGGHIVQGHVDGVGSPRVDEDGFARRLRVGLGPSFSATPSTRARSRSAASA